MPILRWSLLATVVLGAMAAASSLAGPAAWPAAVAWADEQVLRWQRESRECPVLHGSELPGSSRAGYAEAARQASALPNELRVSLRDLVEPASSRIEPTKPQLQSFEALAPAVRALREGAHRTDAALRSNAADTLDIIGLSDCLDALLLTARSHAQLGDTSAAVECLLDGMAYGADLAASAALLEAAAGAWTVARCADAFTDELLQRCDRPSLAALAAALATVDRSIPRDGRLLLLSAAGIVHHLRDAASVSAHDLGMATPLLAWRQGFDVHEFGKARAADFVAIAQRYAASPRDAQEPWPRQRARIAAAVAEEQATNWDLHRSFAHRIVECEEEVRETAARLRLLRLAVAFHGGTPLPKLSDPLAAGDLRAQIDGDRATFLAAGGSLQLTAERRR